MNNDQINTKDEGLDEHWRTALILYHQKWDVSGISLDVHFDRKAP